MHFSRQEQISCNCFLQSTTGNFSWEIFFIKQIWSCPNTFKLVAIPKVGQQRDIKKYFSTDKSFFPWLSWRYQSSWTMFIMSCRENVNHSLPTIWKSLNTIFNIFSWKGKSFFHFTLIGLSSIKSTVHKIVSLRDVWRDGRKGIFLPFLKSPSDIN